VKVLKMASAELTDLDVAAMFDDPGWRDLGPERRRYVADLLYTVALSEPGLRARLDAAVAAGDRMEWGTILAAAVERRLNADEGMN
jgi:hypothetical protein